MASSVNRFKTHMHEPKNYIMHGPKDVIPAWLFKSHIIHETQIIPTWLFKNHIVHGTQTCNTCMSNLEYSKSNLMTMQYPYEGWQICLNYHQINKLLVNCLGVLFFWFLTKEQGNLLNSTKSKTINERKERNRTFDVERWCHQNSKKVQPYIKTYA